MNRWERENAFQLGIEFIEAGFQISQICCSRPSCFDFAARKAPFDFVLNVPDEEYVIIGGVASTNEMDLNARTEEILSVSRVVNAHPVLITEKRQRVCREVFFVSVDELSMMHCPEDLVGCI